VSTEPRGHHNVAETLVQNLNGLTCDKNKRRVDIRRLEVDACACVLYRRAAPRPRPEISAREFES
jgi:hypothetical protein